MAETDSPQTNEASTGGAPPAASMKNTWERMKAFGKEIWHTPDFWARFVIFKTAVAAIIGVCLTGISFIVAAPLALAVAVTAGTALCCAMLFYTGITAWERLRHIYSKNVSNPEKDSQTPRKTVYQRASESRLVKALTSRPAVQKLLKSPQWKKAQTIAKRQEGFVLSYLAGGGSIVIGAVSAGTLITQLVALPVIALGSFLSLSAILPIAGVVSAAIGVIVGVENFTHSLAERERKKHKSEKTADKSEAFAQPAEQSLPAADTLAPVFDKAGAPATAKEEKPSSADAKLAKPGTPPPAAQ